MSNRLLMNVISANPKAKRTIANGIEPQKNDL